MSDHPDPDSEKSGLIKMKSGTDAHDGVQRSATVRSRYTSTGQDSQKGPSSKWNKLKKSTLEFVGLKQTEEEKLHWDAVQQSIMVGRCQKQYNMSLARTNTLRPGSSATTPTAAVTTPTAGVTTPTATGVPAAGKSVVTSPLSPLATAVGLGSSKVSRQTSIRSTTSAASSSSIQRAPITRLTSLPYGGTLQPQAPPDSAQAAAAGATLTTGRLQAVRTDLKPDLWKVAFNSIRTIRTIKRWKRVASLSEEEGEYPTTSFPGLDEDDEDDEDLAEEKKTEGGGGGGGGGVEETDGGGYPSPLHSVLPPDFFSSEKPQSPREMTDASLSRFPPPSLPVIPEDRSPVLADVGGTTIPPKKEPSAHKRLGRLDPRKLLDDPKFGRAYRGVRGRLVDLEGLLRLKHKDIPVEMEKEVARLHKVVVHRPFFTYWLIVVHVLILLITLSVYGFAPYGWDLKSKRALVQMSNLAVETDERNVTTSVWGGPEQAALVLLGAKFAPCMRRDRQLLSAIQSDREKEANSSGCCVRRDQSGCVQLLSEENCHPRFADFVFLDNVTAPTTYNLSTSVRGVCGTSPRTCIDPDPVRDEAWLSNDISKWPICNKADETEQPHLSCELTGRPCCVGIQAHCFITTREHCDFLEGNFHQDAFLCSQVDCLADICGLLPFVTPNVPDQFYRTWLSIFLHAGIIHILLTIPFHLFVLRVVEKKLGWLRTAIIYVGSGIGGSIVSAVFVPYYPEVGPGASIFGTIAFIIVYIIFDWHLLKSPLLEILKMVIILVLALLMGIMLPFLDNYAHLGGFVFGFFLSGIFVRYKRFSPEVLKKIDTFDRELEMDEAERLGIMSEDQPDNDSTPIAAKKRTYEDWLWTAKWVLVVVGLIVVPMLYVVFFVVFYVVQETWDGFLYLNCLPFTSTFCLDYGQTLQSRDLYVT